MCSLMHEAWSIQGITIKCFGFVLKIYVKFIVTNIENVYFNVYYTVGSGQVWNTALNGILGISN